MKAGRAAERRAAAGDGLAARFGATPSILRRGLERLSARRGLARTYGGAMLPRRSTTNDHPGQEPSEMNRWRRGR
jgi:DeoR/GlpR family transcriptional regulator of sugar metabolism